ncbi:putative N-acetyltransferase 8 [Apostichopus japonicus]|uniref:Putative N-acetyltransferase 8 n=1 Tax=Stichopus japonicus TaxID=307972 RepID=A0A2G8KTN2_STIJA|nr:putative N-acetyltransferase 8 [Apostichopus japonicus]
MFDGSSCFEAVILQLQNGDPEKQQKVTSRASIEIQNFTPDLEEIALQLNRDERYTFRAALQRGLEAPFLHISAVFWTIIGWKVLALDLPIACIIAYPWASILFLVMTHVFLNYSHIGEVHSEERGMMWVAMDLTKNPPEVVGMVGIKPLSPTLAKLVRLMVRRPYQGRGIGRALLDTALQFATDMNYVAVNAGTLDVATEFKLFPLYARRGFQLHRTSWAPSFWWPMYKSQLLIKDLN